jgi:predicted transglutaminase-like cysteine proteinase
MCLVRLRFEAGPHLALVLLLLGLSACAGVPKSSPMPIGALTLAPRGFVDFCERNPASCSDDQSSAEVKLTAQRWRELNDVNVAINRQIKPETDEEQYHLAEYWTYTDKAGDCEDYALDKRRALAQKGWPVSALLLTTARNEMGEMHAVLIVSTDQGDFVLDNASDFVTPWSQLPYRWVARQDRTVALAWHRAGTAAAGTGTAALQ